MVVGQDNEEKSYMMSAEEIQRHKTAILGAIAETPGIHFKDLRGQLVKKGGLDSLQLFKLRNELIDNGLIKKTGDYAHFLKGDGEPAIPTAPAPQKRQKLTLNHRAV